VPSTPNTALTMEQSISLEETNKIRISLGLKPLTDDSVPADDKEKQAETNYTKQREAEVKQREQKYVFVLL
jgi:U4/U6.U5 tri-snRNP-associated protein 1